MNIDDTSRVAVVGAGSMGHAIAQEFTRAGYEVSLNDVSEDRLTTALKNIESNLKMMVEIGLATAEQANPVPARIQTSTDLAETVSEADVVVEVAPEDIALKQELFRRLDSLCPPRTILASSSSTIMPSVLGEATDRPDRVLVAHYLMPPYLLPVVEVVRGPLTSDETIQVICGLLERQGKTPVALHKEVPGFLINRLQAALLREAFSLLDDGVVGPEDVDKAFTGALGPRWSAAGPFELMNIHGLDNWLVVLKRLLPLIESSSAPPRLLQEKVAHGEVGARTGMGFFPCPPGAAETLRRRIAVAMVRLR
ncbi:MAG: 3-hydroxyacyl-CoA dehydrogenase family protein [Chloroflexota bacterium]